MTPIDSQKTQEFISEVRSFLAMVSTEYGLQVTSLKPRFGLTDISFTVRLIGSMDSGADLKHIFYNTAQEVIDRGSARIGGIYYVKDTRNTGLHYQARLLESRRGMYLFEYVNYPETGRTTIPFKYVLGHESYLKISDSLDEGEEFNYV